MTVRHVATIPADDQAEPLTVDDAYARSHRAALTPSVIGAVGLEIESHLVDLDSVADRVTWDRVDPLPGSVYTAAGRSSVTLEPGGQFELSGPPASDIVSTVTELRHDDQCARQALGELRIVLLDLLREVVGLAQPGLLRAERSVEEGDGRLALLIRAEGDRKREVEHHDIRLALEDQIHRLDPRIRLAYHRVTELRAADLSNNIPDHQVVFDDDDFHGVST